MGTWIEHLNNPFVLVGFVVFILGGVISLFIRKAKVNQNQNIKGENNIVIAAGRDANLNADNKTQKKNKE